MTYKDKQNIIDSIIKEILEKSSYGNDDIEDLAKKYHEALKTVFFKHNSSKEDSFRSDYSIVLQYLLEKYPNNTEYSAGLSRTRLLINKLQIYPITINSDQNFHHFVNSFFDNIIHELNVFEGFVLAKESSINMSDLESLKENSKEQGKMLSQIMSKLNNAISD